MKNKNGLTRRNFIRNSSMGMLGLAATSPPPLSNGIRGSDIALWDIFSEDFSKNCLAWHHNSDNPVIPATGNNWKKFWTANPDFLEFKGRSLLYYRGNGVIPDSDGHRHDRMAVAEIKKIRLDSFKFKDLNEGHFIVDVGEPGTFDDEAVLDPTTVIFRDQVYLYYSAIGQGPDSVGLAVSRDGVHFEKYGKVMDGRAPSVIQKDGILYMIYQIENGEKGYTGFYLARSKDGKEFKMVSNEPVFMTQSSGGWDNQIATGRLFKQAGYFYLLYGGNDVLVDQPDYFGLARSKDLIHWERHPGNPVFGCSRKGAEDGGAIWFPALIDSGEYYHILYEGSRGNYGWQLSSQVCMASIKKEAL